MNIMSFLNTNYVQTNYGSVPSQGTDAFFYLPNETETGPNLNHPFFKGWQGAWDIQNGSVNPSFNDGSRVWVIVHP
mgnify:FL=1